MRKLRSDSQSFYIKVFTLFVIVLCIYPLHVKSQVRIISHVEEKDYGKDALPRVLDTKTFDDGTVIVRIVRSDTANSTPNRYCNYEMFYLRVIHPNGTIVEKDIELKDVQQFNYCSINNNYEDFLNFEVIRMNQILILYYNTTNVNDTSTYEGWGMMIDLDGNIFDRTFFGTFSYTTEFKIKLNIDRDKGFIIIKYSDEELDTWQQFRVELNGKFTPLTSGMIDGITLDKSAVISTVDGDYAIAYVNTSKSDILADPLTPQGELVIQFIGYNQIDTAIFHLYQTQSPNLTFSSIFCDFEYTGVGQTCSLTVAEFGTSSNNDVTDTIDIKKPNTFSVNNFNNFKFKINFLSSGSVVSFNTINFRIPVIQNTTSIIHNLPFGGYLITTSMDTQNNIIYAYLFAENGTSTPLGLQSNIVSNYAILPNNTILITQQMESDNSWKLTAIDCHKYTNDNGYFNTNIESTFPEMNSVYPSSNVTNIIINFHTPVALSDGRISIYQIDDQSLRQTTSCTLDVNSCTMSNGYKSVIIRVLSFTFSKSGDYYIKIENNFVKNRIYNEPLLGVGDNIWKFTIDDERTKYTLTSSASALLQLTTGGTIKFEKSLNDDDFFIPLLNDLADAVQIQPDRLRMIKHQIINQNSNERQLLVSINIQKTKDQYDKDVDSIISELNSTITFRDQTIIGKQDIAQYLDSNFGFRPTPDYWEEYKFKLLGVFIAIITLIGLYILAHRREKKGHNFSIFRLAIFILDIVLDSLFIINNSNDIPSLFVPSLIFFTLPIGLNIMLAFLIISKENMRPVFFHWFTDNLRLASIFTVLSGADIEVLSILQSNIAGFKIFQAPFSESAKKKIFWGSFSNIFIEDIPQLTIQILYRHYSVTYDMIPILTLITSAMNLTINIIGRLYQAMNYLRDRHKRLSELRERNMK